MLTQQEILNREYDRIATKAMTFAGGTTDDPGDADGDGNPATLFTVTGTVYAKVFAVCTESLDGASATLEAGTALSSAGLIAQTTATNIGANEIWHDTSPDASIEASSVLTEKIVNQDIIQTVGTANITEGSLTYYCLWRPLSENGFVEAA